MMYFVFIMDLGVTALHKEKYKNQ